MKCSLLQENLENIMEQTLSILLNCTLSCILLSYPPLAYRVNLGETAFSHNLSVLTSAERSSSQDLHSCFQDDCNSL